MRDKDNVIHVKAYAFAIRIVNAYRFLCDSQKEFVLSKQLLRSGTAIGALNQALSNKNSALIFNF